MNSITLLLAPALLVSVAGCTTTTVSESRVPIKETAHFTVAHVDPAQVDSWPQPEKLVPPHLQDAIPASGLHEYAIVAFVVDPGGIPREAQWVEASDIRFADLATTAIAESRYRPAQIGGRKVAIVMKQRWEFNANKLSVLVYPPNTTIHPGADPDMRPTEYYEPGVNPRTPTYMPGGGLH